MSEDRDEDLGGTYDDAAETDSMRKKTQPNYRFLFFAS